MKDDNRLLLFLMTEANDVIFRKTGKYRYTKNKSTPVYPLPRVTNLAYVLADFFFFAIYTYIFFTKMNHYCMLFHYLFNISVYPKHLFMSINVPL